MENTMAPMVQEDKDVLLVTGSQELMASAPSILKANKFSVERASAAAKSLIDAIGRNNNVLNAELDASAQAMIVKINATIKKMEDARKPITQIFDAIKKMFTEQEKVLDAKTIGSVTQILQQYRNTYAKQLLYEQQKRQKEAADLAEIENKKEQLKATIINKIGLILSNFRYQKLVQRKASFDTITLENFYEKENAINNLMCVFDNAQLKSILVYDIPVTTLDDTTRDMVKKEVQDNYDYTAFGLEYHKLLSEQKREFIDNLPSKRAELEAIASAGAAQKIEMEKLRKQREDEEAEQMRLQKLEQEKLAAETVQIQATAATAHNLFNQAVSATPEVPAPEARTGYELVILHPAGLVEIFTAWYQKEGMNLPIEESRKKTINQMCKFLENAAAAKKDAFFIKSTFLKYEATAKAVNRKIA